MTLRNKPEKRDPLRRKIDRHVPPGLRSRAMHAMSARAAQGRLVLQRCVDCAAVTYPPRDVCPACWGDLVWEDQPTGATLIAKTTVQATTDLYFRGHLPWRMGTIELDGGPIALAHLSSRISIGGRADVRLMLDKGGNAALFALPAGEQPDMTDRQWREFVVPVKDATILVTDGASEIGAAVVASLHAAGAASITVGIAPPHRAPAGLAEMQGVRFVPLDVTDTRSVSECLTDIAGPVDIVVNSARFVRGGHGLLDQKQAFEVSVMGLSRLIQVAGPMLSGRPSAAFVDILSTAAIAPDISYPAFSAAEAARLSLLQSFRCEMRSVGVRVLSVFTGPVDDADHQRVTTIKVAPARIGKGVVDALESGQELFTVGDAARDEMARWSADPMLFLREKNL